MTHNMLKGDSGQHEDFNCFFAWSRYIPKTYLCGVVEVAVDFASSTGLCEVQGILPHLPRD